MVNPTNEPMRINEGIASPPPVGITTDDPQVIRAQIGRTRAQMGLTLNEIQMRLSPDYIRQQTQESIREATIEKVEKMAQTAEHTVNNWRSNAVQTAKENPLPTALVGIGIGWLLLAKKNNNGHTYEDNYRESYYAPRASYGRSYNDEYDTYEEESMLEQAQARVSDVAENTQEWVSETAGRAQQTAKDATETVTQQVHATSEAVRENVNLAAEQARIKAAQTRRRAKRQTRRAKRSFWQTMEENPLAIGAAAAAAGALIGMALPSTEKENELMGETRDRLVEDASTSVQETMRKVQTVAEKVAQTATEKVQEEGVDQQNLPTPTTLQSMKGHETQSTKASTSA